MSSVAVERISHMSAATETVQLPAPLEVPKRALHIVKPLAEPDIDVADLIRSVTNIPGDDLDVEERVRSHLLDIECKEAEKRTPKPLQLHERTTRLGRVAMISDEGSTRTVLASGAELFRNVTSEVVGGLETKKPGGVLFVPRDAIDATRSELAASSDLPRYASRQLLHPENSYSLRNSQLNFPAGILAEQLMLAGLCGLVVVHNRNVQENPITVIHAMNGEVRQVGLPEQDRMPAEHQAHFVI